MLRCTYVNWRSPSCYFFSIENKLNYFFLMKTRERFNTRLFAPNSKCRLNQVQIGIYAGRAGLTHEIQQSTQHGKAYLDSWDKCLILGQCKRNERPSEGESYTAHRHCLHCIAEYGQRRIGGETVKSQRRARSLAVCGRLITLVYIMVVCWLRMVWCITFWIVCMAVPNML